MSISILLLSENGTRMTIWHKILKYCIITLKHGNETRLKRLRNVCDGTLPCETLVGRRWNVYKRLLRNVTFETRLKRLRNVCDGTLPCETLVGRRWNVYKRLLRNVTFETRLERLRNVCDGTLPCETLVGRRWNVYKRLLRNVTFETQLKRCETLLIRCQRRCNVATEMQRCWDVFWLSG